MAFLGKRSSLPQTTSQANQAQIATFQASKPIPYGLGTFPYIGANFISDSFNWLTAPGGKGAPPYEYCSIATAFCVGPVNFIGNLKVGGQQIGYIGHTVSPGEDYIDYTLNAHLALGQAWWVRIYFGTETQTADASLIAGTGQQHPPYKGICYAVWHNIDLGQGNTNIPSFELEIGRGAPAVGGFGAGYDRTFGVNPFAGIYTLITDAKGGLGADLSFLNPTHWGNQATALEATGIAQRTGNLTKINFCITDFKDAASAISEALTYVDGYIKCRDGQLQVGWFPHKQISNTGLPQITEADLVEKPGGGGFENWNGALSDAVVTFLDINLQYTQQAATYRAPANRETQIAKNPQQVDRPMVHDSGQAAYIAAETANSFTQGDTGTSLKIMQSRAVNLDGSPLMPGDLFVWFYDSQEIEIIVRVIERQEDGAGAVTLIVIFERGAFPQPFVSPFPAPPGKVNPAAVDINTAAARLWFLPSGFGGNREITALVNRPDAVDIGFNLWFSANGSAPWELALTSHTFSALCTLHAAIGAPDATVNIASGSPDFINMQAQSALAQSNDTLLLLIGDEVCSVGSITSIGGGVYTLGILRARKGTIAAAALNGATAWLFYASTMQTTVWNEFYNVRTAGVYDATLATKHFKFESFTQFNEGNQVPGGSGLAFTFPDLSANDTAGTRTFFQPTQPQGQFNVGDLWFDTSNGNHQWRWNGSAWVNVQDIQMLANLASVLTALNGVNHIYYQGTAPNFASTPPPINGDFWFNTASQMACSQYVSGAWTPFSGSVGSGVAYSQVAAGAILAGTITAAISLESPLINTVGACYNTSNPAQTFPTTSVQNGTMGAAGAGDYSLITFYGWELGSGFSKDVFGASGGTQTFSVSAGGKFSLTSTTNAFEVDLEYRINGGSWNTFGPAWISVNTGSGAWDMTRGVSISLAGTDYIEFGIKVSGLINASLNSADLIGLCFNL